MARQNHRAAPEDLIDDEGVGNTDATCKVCHLGINRRYNTQRANKVLEADPMADVDGPEFWYWTHDERPDESEADLEG